MSNVGPLDQDLRHRIAGTSPDPAQQPGEQLFWATFNSSPAAQVITELDTGRILEVNEAYCRLVGYPRTALLGHSTPELDIWLDLEEREEVLWELQRSGHVRDKEFKIRTSTGAVRAQLASFELFELQGKTCVVSSTIDITERKQAEEALRRSEERFRTAFDYMLEGAQIIGFDWRYIYLNDMAQAHSRRPKEELLGNRYMDMWPGSEDTHLFAMMKRCMADRTPCRMQNEFVYPDGLVRWFELSIQPIPEGTFILSIDITERKQAEIELRRSEEQYRGLVKTLDSTVAAIDYDGRVLFMNDLAAATLGRGAADLIGKTLLELFPGPAGARQLESIRQVILTGQGSLTESQIIIRGDLRWHRTSIQPIHDENGRVVYALINSNDIHDLKQAQQELLELNHTLEERIKERTAEVQDLYENAPAGYHSLDVNGRFVRINQTELNWLGYTREEVIGHPFLEFVTPGSRPVFHTNFPKFLATGYIRDLEFDLVRKDGTTLSVLISATAIYDAAGRFLISRSTIFDNSARKQAEDALRLANLEMERAIRLKDEFLANMSHELRTPLTGMLALGENLQELIYGPLNERQLKVLSYIETSSRHLLSLINDLLDLSKIEAGGLDLELQPVLVDDITQASLLFVKEMAHKKNIQLTCRSDQPHVIVVADGRRLKQMLVNLLGNAVKFTPDGGRVQLHVMADAAAGEIRFVVQDTGVGILPEAQGRLFQPFTQLDSALARQYEGTGLGLALVKRLAAQHGGSVSVASSGVPGEGSCFTVVLPYNIDTDFTQAM
jgi:PAS domain S-box-containing protein